MADDIREALRESIQEAKSAEASSVSDSGGAAVLEDVSTGGGAESGSTVATDAPAVAEASSTGPARDPETGKFTKSATETPKAAKPAVTPKPVAAQPVTTGTPTPAVATPSSPKYKAPQAWTPAVREKWGALPEEVQAEVDRLERDTKRALQEAAKPREFHQKFQETVAPYMGMIQSEGGDPVRAVGSLLQTAAVLRSPMPDTVAGAIGDIVKRFGIGRFGPQFIESLARAIDGQGGEQQAVQQPQFDPNAFAQQITQSVLGQLNQRQAKADLEQMRPEMEFLDDVRDEMHDLMAVAARRGLELTPKDAYNRALQLHPEIIEVLKQREAAEAAKAAQASTQRARAAAVSVKSEPTGAQAAPTKGNSVRDDLRASIAELRNR